MKTPLTYYGGKQKLAAEIISLFPRHRVYCEPFCGGAAVFFAKMSSKVEVLNDHDKRIVTFYKVLQDDIMFAALQDMVYHTLHFQSLYDDAKAIWQGKVQPTDDVQLAWSVWLSCCSSFSGTPSGGWSWDNGASRSHMGVVLSNYRKRICQAVHDRLRYVQIHCDDAANVIVMRDTPDTLFYCDPPYFQANKGHYSDYNAADFAWLLETLASIKGRFILSSYPSDMLQDYTERLGWHTLTYDMNLSSANFCSSHKHRKTEVLTFNFPAPVKLF